MPPHKLLKGVADGIIDSFISRNNDIDGYWGPGKLYLLAIELGVKELTLDLLRVNREKTPRTIEIAEEQYRQKLATNLKKAGVDPSKVESARIVIAFETHGEDRVGVLKLPRPSLDPTHTLPRSGTDFIAT